MGSEPISDMRDMSPIAIPLKHRTFDKTSKMFNRLSFFARTGSSMYKEDDSEEKQRKEEARSAAIYERKKRLLRCGMEREMADVISELIVRMLEGTRMSKVVNAWLQRLLESDSFLKYIPIFVEYTSNYAVLQEAEESLKNPRNTDFSESDRELYISRKIDLLFCLNEQYMKILLEHSHYADGPSDIRVFEYFYFICEQLIDANKQINNKLLIPSVKAHIAELMRSDRFNPHAPMKQVPRYTLYGPIPPEMSPDFLLKMNIKARDDTMELLRTDSRYSLPRIAALRLEQSNHKIHAVQEGLKIVSNWRQGILQDKKLFTKHHIAPPKSFSRRKKMKIQHDIHNYLHVRSPIVSIRYPATDMPNHISGRLIHTAPASARNSTPISHRHTPAPAIPQTPRPSSRPRPHPRPHSHHALPFPSDPIPVPVRYEDLIWHVEELDLGEDETCQDDDAQNGSSHFYPLSHKEHGDCSSNR